MRKIKNIFPANFANVYPLIAQVFRFGIVGLTAAMIHFGTVVMLVQTFDFAPLVANVFGFSLAFQASYWGHKNWTFNASQTMHVVAVPKLLFIQILNFLANESLFYFFLAMHLPYQMALLIAITILPIFTFFSSKLWVFRY